MIKKKASYTVVYNAELKIIETTVDGDIDLSVLKEIFTMQAQTSKDSNCNLMLNDYRNARIKITVMEIYELPKIIAKIAASFGRSASRTIRALVIPTFKEDYRFYETVTANNSQTEKLFFDIEEAKKMASSISLIMKTYRSG
ncbi:MAG: hypothetical protein U0V18_04935 [Anaerolineales bacterium]